MKKSKNGRNCLTVDWIEKRKSSQSIILGAKYSSGLLGIESMHRNGDYENG